MRSIKSLTIVVLLVIYIQNIESKNVEDKLKPADNGLPGKSYPLATRERDLRGFRDQIWNQVKSTTISSWNFLKKISEDARIKLKEWANSAREYAVQLEKSFEKQLQDFQGKMKDVITDLLGTGKLVQECIRIEGKNIESALKDVLENMSQCISNQIKQLTQIKGKHAELNLNDTLFLGDLDNNLAACEYDKDNYEECLYTVRGAVYDEIKGLDNHIQKTSLQTRSLADDIMNTLSSCSLQNLAEASSHVTTEMMQVVRCVLDSLGVNATLLDSKAVDEKI